MPRITNKQYAERLKLDRENAEKLRLALIREKKKKHKIPLPDNQKGFYLVTQAKYNAYLKSLNQNRHEEVN